LFVPLLVLRAAYNTDHALLDFYLASAWGLPKYIKQVILHHHNVIEHIAFGSKSIDEDRYGYLKNNLLCILKMAEHIDKRFWSDDEDFEWNRVRHDVLGYLGLSVEDFEELRSDMLEQLEMKG